MSARERLKQWDARTPEWRRKEIYEKMIEAEEFSAFLGLLEECREMARQKAQYARDETERVSSLGSATAIDDLVADMIEVVGIVRDD